MRDFVVCIYLLFSAFGGIRKRGDSYHWAWAFDIAQGHAQFLRKVLTCGCVAVGAQGPAQCN